MEENLFTHASRCSVFADIQNYMKITISANFQNINIPGICQYNLTPGNALSRLDNSLLRLLAMQRLLKPMLTCHKPLMSNLRTGCQQVQYSSTI